MRIVRNTCLIDCLDTCSVLAHVDGDRLVRLSGDHPGRPYRREPPSFDALPITATFIPGANPVAQHARPETVRDALLSREFNLVVEKFLTYTPSAHLVLPVATFLENENRGRMDRSRPDAVERSRLLYKGGKFQTPSGRFLFD